MAKTRHEIKQDATIMEATKQETVGGIRDSYFVSNSSLSLSRYVCVSLARNIINKYCIQFCNKVSFPVSITETIKLIQCIQ